MEPAKVYETAVIGTEEYGVKLTVRDLNPEKWTGAKIRLGVERHGSDQRMALLDQFDARRLRDVLDAFLRAFANDATTEEGPGDG